VIASDARSCVTQCGSGFEVGPMFCGVQGIAEAEDAAPPRRWPCTPMPSMTLRAVVKQRIGGDLGLRCIADRDAEPHGKVPSVELPLTARSTTPRIVSRRTNAVATRTKGTVQTLGSALVQSHHELYQYSRRLVIDSFLIHSCFIAGCSYTLLRVSDLRIG
jgi:hypothetical protein